MEDKWVSCVKLNDNKYILKLVKRDKFNVCESTDVVVDKEFIEQTVSYLKECITK